jgi:HAE1 family hydrophobic/amphiphilic exporter-1
MKFSHFFIDRPIFAAVLSIVLIVIGIVAYTTLPVTQYPEVAPPTITVSTQYPGANAQVIGDTVATPLEQEINGVEGMIYMYSQSTNDGRMQLTITFRPGTDLDQAQVLVQNRVSVAEPRLPEEVRRIGIVTRKASPDILMVVHLYSPDESLDQLYISNYLTLQVRDVLARLDGVGDINIFGGRDYSMRLWLDVDRISSLGLTAGDVVNAVREQNRQVAGGTLGEPPLPEPQAFQTSIVLQGRLTDPEQFANIVVKTGDDGRFIRVKDVARVELGSRDYATNSYLNGKPAVASVIAQRPGSNALATANAVKATMEELKKSFPPGLTYEIVYNPTEYIAESARAVVQTIFEAVVLVVLVVVVFLQTWRAAIIPIVAIPVSLVGTFAIMALLGFSLNNLTLFGLVLAIGIVVDDAIVVVENVERNLQLGMSPREAARRTMDEVGGALISIALVLCAVFVPSAFLTGITGEFYRQFAISIAAATVISLINSLTLSPALCALLLKPHGHGPERNDPFSRFFRWFNRGFTWLSRRYGQEVCVIVRRAGIVLGVYAVLIALTGFAFWRVPTGFIPAQDQGYLITAIQLPDGASLSRTDEVMHQVENIILDTPGVNYTVSFAGFSGATRTNAPNAGAVFFGLAPFGERRSAAAILAEVQQKLFAIQDAFVIVITPPPIQGIGTSGGFSMMVQDRSGAGPRALEAAVQSLAMAANQQPGLTNVFSFFRATTPQLYVDVDRTRSEILDVPLANVFEALEIYLGSSYVNDFNYLGRTYRVTAQAEPRFRTDPKDIGNLRTRNMRGEIVPLGTLVKVNTVTGPDLVSRYNAYPAARLDGNLLPGTSSGQGLATMERLASQSLPAGFNYAWTDLSYQQKQTGNEALAVFALSVLFVFLVLAAQYESWTLPLAVILIVPMCLLAGLGGIALRGMDNNVLTQIGFVVLVGLASKNAILIVEFARQLEREGKSIADAAIEACRLRLRPILMTSFAFILGVVPLVIASGAGSEMRQALGTAVFFGMLGVTVFGLVFTPVFYVVIRSFVTRRARRGGAGEPSEEEPKPQPS